MKKGTIAPRIFAVEDSTLKDELARTVVADEFDWWITATTRLEVITGVRDDGSPVTIMRAPGRGAMHLVSVPYEN